MVSDLIVDEICELLHGRTASVWERSNYKLVSTVRGQWVSYDLWIDDILIGAVLFEDTRIGFVSHWRSSTILNIWCGKITHSESICWWVMGDPNFSINMLVATAMVCYKQRFQK
jgi:hypothetical protein